MKIWGQITLITLAVAGLNEVTAGAVAKQGVEDQYIISPDSNPEFATVYDTKTGYTWQQAMSSAMLPFSEAQAYCASYAAGGLSAGSWHLPSADEAMTLVNTDFVTDSRGYHPRGNPASTFPNMLSNEIILTNASSGIILNMDSGQQHYSHIDITLYKVKCVSN